MKELQQAQHLYDEQTDYSRNLVQQKNWLIKINNYLDNLKEF